jgi:alkyl hydroperoxide reductase subunit AhpF
MPILSDRDREAIAGIFAESLVDPVQVVYFTMPASKLFVPGRATCETCADVQELIEEVASTSDKVSVEVHNIETEREEARRYGVDRVPAIVLTGKAQGSVRYFGAPAGSEFPNFIQDIQRISTGETALSPDTREALAAITDPIHLQVFVTPT